MVKSTELLTFIWEVRKRGIEENSSECGGAGCVRVLQVATKNLGKLEKRVPEGSTWILQRPIRDEISVNIC